MINIITVLYVPALAVNWIHGVAMIYKEIKEFDESIDKLKNELNENPFYNRPIR